MTTFKRAERKSAKLRAAICGTSGSGKTYSALLLAKGLGQRIAVIDTERGSSELYSDVCEYDVAQLEPPYTPRRYIALIKEASKEYDVIIIDSLSHAWSGEGGVLEMHDNAARAERGGSSFTAWRTVTPEHNALVDAILTAPCHVICSMRSKTAYELIDDGKGKKKPVKIGLAPEQRGGLEYEFTLVLDVSVDGHVASASKDRTRIWENRNEVIAGRHGEELRNWLESGVVLPPPPPAKELRPSDFAGEINAIGDKAELRAWLTATAKKHGWSTQDGLYVGIKTACTLRAEKIDAAEAAAAASSVQTANEFEHDLGPVD